MQEPQAQRSAVGNETLDTPDQETGSELGKGEMILEGQQFTSMALRNCEEEAELFIHLAGKTISVIPSLWRLAEVETNICKMENQTNKQTKNYP